MFVVRVLLVLGCVAVVLVTLDSVVRIFVLPRGERNKLARVVMLTARVPFDLLTSFARSYERQDRVMALFAPLGLLVLLAVWLVLMLLAFTGIFWGLGIRPWQAAFVTSGSSLFTLGFASVNTVTSEIVAFIEAALGLILVAILISYLPTLYAAFSHREAAVAMLEVRAGTPPSALEMLKRFHRLGRMNALARVWEDWEMWFTEVQENHTSHAVLAFFRSPNPQQSWVTAAGAVLDTGALYNAALDLPRDVQIDLCLRAGYLALHSIARFHGLDTGADSVSSSDPISISRSEFDDALDDLAAAGLPLKPDRDQAWRDFAGWRANYDLPLLALAMYLLVPYAPWSSDRGPVWRHPFLPPKRNKK